MFGMRFCYLRARLALCFDCVTDSYDEQLPHEFGSIFVSDCVPQIDSALFRCHIPIAFLTWLIV